MAFEEVRIVDPYVEKGWTPEIKLTLASSDEVDALQSELGVVFPEGYREFVTALGLGDYCNFIRIYMPSKLLSDYEKHQKSLEEYWFWDLGKDVFSKERATESIKIGETDHGDVIVFHPENPRELFVLPRSDDMLYRIGSNLYEAIDWLCIARHNPQSGSVGETHKQRYFVPANPFARTHGVLIPEEFLT